MSGDGPKIISLVDKLDLPPEEPTIQEVLRKMADDIDAGEFGATREIAIVMTSKSGLIMKQGGEGSNIHSMHMLLSVATKVLQDMCFRFPG